MKGEILDKLSWINHKPLYLGNTFSCIVKCLCLVDIPFLVVSCLKKNKRWDFTEQFWLQMPFGHRALSLKFDRNLTIFFLKNQRATTLEAVFVSTLFEISPFSFVWKIKNKKKIVFVFNQKICTKRQPLQTALFQVNRPFFVVCCLKRPKGEISRGYVVNNCRSSTECILLTLSEISPFST